METARNITQDETAKVLDRFYNRVKISTVTFDEVEKELNSIAQKFSVDREKLFVLAETTQLPFEVSNQILSLHRISKTLAGK
jgi:hypothetical protein